MYSMVVFLYTSVKVCAFMYEYTYMHALVHTYIFKGI